MLVLGLQGSPRIKGNTNYLLSVFLDAAKELGARTHTIQVARKNIEPCRGCGYCEKKGFCVIEDDDMKSEIFPLIREADVVVAATPIYFYSASGQLKILIDRCQSLWSRKYKFKLSDPKSKTRKGVLLAVGATKGENLFEGIALTAKYFFDGIDAKFTGRITYRRIENIGDMEHYPTVKEDAKRSAEALLNPMKARKKIIFACRENACRSQMASAFAQYLGGDKVDAWSGGSEPKTEINPVMLEVMREKGIDLAFRKPRSLEDAISEEKPDMIVTMGCGEACPFIPGVKRLDWDLPDPAGKPIEFMREVREQIEKNVLDLLPHV